MLELLSATLAQEATASAAGASKSLPIAVVIAIFALGAAFVGLVAWRIRTVHLALGFAATASMWAIGYVSMLAPGLWIGEVLFAATLAMPLAFGAIARRAGESPVKVGLVSAFANLLIVGAFLRDWGFVLE